MLGQWSGYSKEHKSTMTFEQLKRKAEISTISTLMKYLKSKNHSDILSFLYALEETHQSHILNYVLCQSGDYLFLISCTMGQWHDSDPDNIVQSHMQN